jgi:hypothetical protein
VTASDPEDVMAKYVCVRFRDGEEEQRRIYCWVGQWQGWSDERTGVFFC